MQMVQSLAEVGKILLHYSRKKDFQSPSKQILSKSYLMLPPTLRQRNTFLFVKLTTHHSTSTLILTTHLQSSSSCLKWSTREFQIYLVIKKNSTKLSPSTNQHWRVVDILHLTVIAIVQALEKIETGRLHGSTHHIAKMWKQILVNCSSSLWGNTSPRTANTIRFSTSTLWS